ncbi:ATP-dependent DNA ligase [Plantactinospora sp. CA-290183]|uniref:ATP-dependent DNA ligase n=1 Tax=Plantactinospora sp. CA-290183 TaxID=3240006 RepID=UPI003D8A4A8F
MTTRTRGNRMLRPPIEPMRARAITDLPDVGHSGATQFEPKWDGWRAVAFIDRTGVMLQSRAGRPLHPYFPDVCRALAATLPPGTVVDGELVAWEVTHERTSFPLLQRRITAGRHLPEETRQHPAHLVIFDLLQESGAELLKMPLTARRAHLTRLLADGPPQLPLCPQTRDREVALTWFDHGPQVGIEGLVAKASAGAYRLGRADWLKMRKRASTEAVIGGVVGPLTDPIILLLGRFDLAGRLRYVGRTTPLPRPQRQELGALLPITAWSGSCEAHPWPQPLPPAWSGHFDRPQPTTYLPVEPVIIVEVSADVAWERGRWRHPLRLLRIRLDLEPEDIELLSTPFRYT